MTKSLSKVAKKLIAEHSLLKNGEPIDLKEKKENNQKKEEKPNPTAEQLKRIREAITQNKLFEKFQIKIKLRHENNAVKIILEQIISRKKLGLKKDWKIKFLQSKLGVKEKTIVKLTELIK